MSKPVHYLTFKFWIPIVIGLFLASGLLGCKQKNTILSVEKSALMVVLKEGVTCNEIIEKYPEFYFSNPKVVSRTENKWSIDWQVEVAKREHALTRLRENSLIISADIIQDTISPPSNSTNAGHTKTKPIKNK